jgi:alcohol dehydrogenase
MGFHFFVKSNLEFGIGSAAVLPDLIRKHDLKKVMVIYDGGVKAAGIAEKVLAEVKKAEVPYVIFDGVIPNPTNEVVETAAALAKEEKVDGFVAVGGGSSIDTAKAVNVLMTNPGTIGEYGGMNMVKNPCLPLIAVPTTAGTSSEITNVSALIDTQKVVKYVVIDDKITPSDVIADPEFTRTAPAGVTAATGMDAITHAVESYISNMATPLTKYNSLKGLQVLYQNIERVVADGNDMAQIEAAFQEAHGVTGMPVAIIIKTVKGKGVSFMENQAGWHGKAPNDEQYAVAMEDLKKVGDAICQK